MVAFERGDPALEEHAAGGRCDAEDRSALRRRANVKVNGRHAEAYA